MTSLLPQCSNLADNVKNILNLLAQEANLTQEISAIEASLKKAVAPKFEIVFAGAFSAGKSMLINALLERELLYSAEGHATGTECYIEYSEPEAERVVLTFLSEREITEQATALYQQLGIFVEGNITDANYIEPLIKKCLVIIDNEGGESKSERAKQAKALSLLLEGFENNCDRIADHHHTTYSMEEFNFSNLAEAANYAKRGSNSSVLKKVEYYCHHSLLKDGNILVDTPGIDAPVKKDAELTYSKIEHPDTSAVICVLKAAAAGEMSSEETELLEKIRSNPSIRDRVFYVFNRIDSTWYNGQLRQRLNDLIAIQFQNQRVYQTSGLLGFYGSQILPTNTSDRFGLDSLLAQHLEQETNLIVTNDDREFEENFQQLKAKMVSRLDELLQTFSVQNAYSSATLSHPRNATAPLIAILVEALYYISNELEDVLVTSTEELIKNFCQRLSDRIKNKEYYRQLYRLLNNDNNLDLKLQQLEQQLLHALISAARTECDRYVRESPRFYDENTFSIYQFRQTLQQTSENYDCSSMVKAEPAIRQLLKLDFEPKVSATICRNFRQTVNNTLKTQLLPMAKQQGDEILQQYPQAKANLSQILEQEAISKIARNQQLKNNIEQKIQQYNLAVSGINNCLSAMQLFDYHLPTIVTESGQVNVAEQDITDNINGYHNNYESILNTTDS